jgi:amino acid transporter
VTSQNQGRLGTFGGVFTPSILTILGIILFLRLGYVVGNAGLVKALLIIGGATAVSVLTSISVAAIATNIEVRGGGDYYLISRTLGMEFGGAIGIVLFLAQSVSVGFYAIGFGEAVASVAGWEAQWASQVIAAVAIAGLFVLAWAGADVATRFQYVVMVALVAALISFYLGALEGAAGERVSEGLSSPDGALGFWVVFAIFFPAVTGFTQGVSMSGDLREPGKSLPRGTFVAVGLSTLVYISVAVLLAANATRTEMIDDTGIMNTVAKVPALIDAGVIAATLSSAMASLLGGPRILQSLASDRIFPALGFFAKGHGAAGNPRRAVLLTLAIGMGTIALGDLDAIAPVVSMFFLISYGLLNYATYFEAQASSPSFRPRFRFFNRRSSLIGALLCLGAMLAINPLAGAAAVLVLGGIYQYLARRARPERWADASHSHHFQRAKESLQAMTAEVETARNWRPQLLVFSADPLRRERLLRFATWMEGRSGLTAAMLILEGGGAMDRKAREEEEATLRAQIAALGLNIHARVVLAPNGMEALATVVQSFGVGPLEANTALFGLPEQPDRQRRAAYVTALQEVARYGQNVVVMSTDEARWNRMVETPQRQRRIDVWWNDGKASTLAALTAYLFTRTPEWSRAEIRIVVPVAPDADAESVRADLTESFDVFRIPASIHTVAQATPAAMVKASADAALVLLPMRLREGNVFDQFGNEFDRVVAHLPMTAGFLAGAPVDLAAGPESGPPGRLAIAEREAAEARERLAALHKQLDKVAGEIAELRVRAEESPQRHERRKLADAEKRLEATRRRIIKATAREEAANAAVARLLGGNGGGA